ncbi:hypothetical protein L914_05688 [Phytophthora nicotianae]|uniref:Uncharacterized protein n=1 Tax=Phytophthora nicotianae TaxID=4792 RepID=W2NNV3_PHYNI|nr:hypothetical protein L914_05688 [Phytophthora nicotianae]
MGSLLGLFRADVALQYTIDVWNVFPTPHPSMATFVTVMKTIAAEYVRRIGDVPRAHKIPHEWIHLPEPVNIPSDIDVDEATALALRPSDSTPVFT